jgi:hypothetical protein
MSVHAGRRGAAERGGWRRTVGWNVAATEAGRPAAGVAASATASALGEDRVSNDQEYDERAKKCPHASSESPTEAKAVPRGTLRNGEIPSPEAPAGSPGGEHICVSMLRLPAHGDLPIGADSGRSATQAAA